MPEYRSATIEDAVSLAPRLRAADRLELLLSHGDPDVALRQSVSISEETIAALDNGVVIAIGGVAKFGTIGVPWLLGADPLVKHRIALLREVRPWVDKWQKRYRRLANSVHADNHVSIAWLKRLGFTIHPAVPFGVRGAPFHPFSRLSHV